MKLYYQGVNIAPSVEISECIHRESSGGKSDCLEIVFEDAQNWYSWQPKADDTISVNVDGYDTGTMYLNTVFPQDGKFRVLATGVSKAGRTIGSEGYSEITLENLISNCAAACGMEGKLYGMDGTVQYRYLVRDRESTAGFIDRILRMEGAGFKTVSGRFAGIGIQSIQEQEAAQSIYIRAGQTGITHIDRPDKRLSGLTVKTPFGEASAYDDGASDGNYRICVNAPAQSDTEAGRWARGLLLMHNRMAETIRMETEFNPGLSALGRVRLVSESNMDGEWIADEVEHDLLRGKSACTLVRCITTIR